VDIQRAKGRGQRTESVGSYNRKLIMEEIRRYGPLTRPDLAKRTGLTRAAVGKIVNDLYELGLVTEEGFEVSSGGRRPVLLQVRKDRYVVGAHLDGQGIQVAVVGLDAAVRSYRDIPWQRNGGSVLLQDVIDALRGVIAQDGLTEEELLGIGLSIPGLFDYTNQEIIVSFALGWERVPLAKFLQQELNVPVVAERDCLAGLFGELWFGDWHSVDDAMYVVVGEGIGAGLWLSGQPFRGSGWMAGELGHVSVDDDGVPCQCGQRGCLEVMASLGVMARQWWSAGALSEDFIERYVKALKDRDERAWQVLREGTRHIGKALGQAINLLDPEMIFVAGRLDPVSEEFIDVLGAATLPHVMKHNVREVRIVPASFGPYHSVMGAAAAFLWESFNHL